MKEWTPSFPWYVRGTFFGGMEDVKDDAPMELLPLARFNHPQLRKRATGASDAGAERRIGLRIAKGCAGLNPHYRCTGVELLRALRRGTLSGRETVCFNWTLSAMRTWQMHEVYSKWALSIYELARIVHCNDDVERCLNPWLNLWGRNPDRPLPEPDGLTRKERARQRGYEIDFEVSGTVGPVRADTGERVREPRWESHSDALAWVPAAGLDALTTRRDKRYTEEDIARLEAGDLTDATVCSELLTAYYQNDAPRDKRFRLKRDVNVFAPEAGLREKLADLEAVEDPSAEIRGDRLRILSRLAMLRKQHGTQADR